MNKKKRIIAIISISLAVLIVCGLFSAAWLVVGNAENLKFGGLIGEILGNQQDPPQLFPDDTSNQPPTDQELMTESQVKDPYSPVFFIDAARIQDALMMGTLQEDGAYVSLTVDDTWQNYAVSLLPPGSSYSNVTSLVITHRTDDYFAQGCFTIGPRNDANFRDIRFDYFHRDDYYGPVWRTSIIEISDLFYDNPHNYISYLSFDPLVDPQSGQSIDIAYIAGFSSREDAEMYLDSREPPVFMADAAYLADMLENQPNKGIESFRYWSSAREDNGVYPLGNNGHVTVYPVADYANPYFTVCPYTGELYSTGARYLAIKCRWGKDSARIYISPSTPEQGDYYTFQYTEWDWQLIIIDLAEVGALNDSYDIGYLYFDFFAEAAEAGNSFEVAWIATFKSIEAAQKYDTDHPYAYG